MDWATLIIAGITGLIGAIVGSGGVGAVMALLFKHRLDLRQQTHDHNVATITRLEARIVTLEGHNRECLEAHAKTREEVGELRGRLHRLEHESK